MRTILAALYLGAALSAQAAIITVNDAKSHGLVGDTKLSLDEAIQIVNLDSSARPAFFATMSAAEQAQIVVSLSGDDWIKVDAATVPLITYEQEITPIVTGIHQHQDLDIDGFGMPTIDAKTFSAAFPVKTNHAHIHGFVIVGGKTAIEADSSLHFHAGDIGEFGDLRISGQSEAGMRFPVLNNPPGQSLPFALHDITITGDPIGLELNDQGSFENLDVIADRVHMQSCTLGVKIACSSTGGINCSLMLYRCSIVNSDTCVQIRRPVASSDGTVFMRVAYGDFTATHNVIDVQGSAIGETTLHTHHAFFRCGSSSADYALITYPKSARFDLHLTEMSYDGSLLIQGSRDTRRVFMHNSWSTRGSITIDNDGVVPNFQWNVFLATGFNVAAGSRTPFTMNMCEFVNCPIAGNSLVGGNLTLEACYVGASPISGAVTNNNPTPARWIGRASVAPVDPPLGGFVDLTLDFQPGMAGFWVLGDELLRPKTGNIPYRFYLDLLKPVVAIPGVYQLRDRVRLPIPFNSALVGVSLYAQPVAVPINPGPPVTGITLPPGGRFRIQ